jgi:hypothetical protein
MPTTRKSGSKTRRPRAAAVVVDFSARLATLASLNESAVPEAPSAKDLDRMAKAAHLERGEVERVLGSVRLEKQSGIAAALLYHLTDDGETPTYSGLLNKPPEVLRQKLAPALASGALGHDAQAGLAGLEARRSRYETIASVAARAKLRVSPRLQSLLRSKKLSTLDDVVQAGGLRRSIGSGPLKNDAGAAALDALAEFSLLPEGMEAGSKLLEAGYRGVAELARSAPSALEKRLAGQLDAATVARLQDAAVQRLRLANTFFTGQWVAGERDVHVLGEQFAALADICHCCSDATSGLAYLADLLDYTVRHVSYGGNAVTLAFLQQRLHQPFGELPVRCADDETVLRQVRICIEVLRDMLAAPDKTATPQPYLETAYRRFLEMFGTSFDELRALPAMKAADAEALAESLQVRSAARLEELLRDPDAGPGDALEITEAWLQQFFGLRDTTQPPLQPDTDVPWTMDARLDYWRAKWRTEDADDATSPLGAHPLLDPDLVGLADLAELPEPKWQINFNKTQWSVLDFIESRAHWVDVCIGTLQTFRRPAGAAPRTLAQMLVALAQALTVPDVAVAVTADLTDVNNPLKLLVSQRQERDRGEDITAWLAQVHLTDDEFEQLSRMATVEARGQTITESDWKDFNAIVIQRARKLEVLQTWRNEERNAAPSVSLLPRVFHLRASVGAADWRATLWRSDSALRRRWELTLRGRIAQEQALADETRAAIDTVEHEMLVALRDDRMRAAAAQGLLGPGAGLLTRERRRWFTANLLIDGETSDCAKTTRTEQAIKTVQGLLFGIRNGLLEDTAWDIDAPDFDATWQWLGTYATWNAAMQVFLHPQRALRPTLRKIQSPGSAAMVEACRASARLTLAEIRDIAAEYRRYFIDVCNLIPVAAHAGGLPKRTFFAVARSDASGALLFSSWTEASGWGSTGAPDQAPWAYLPWDAALEGRLASSEQEIANLLPFRDAQGRRGVAVFARLRSVAQVDWAKAVWLSGTAAPFSACEQPAPLWLTDQRHVIAVGTRSATLAPAASAPWTFATTDTIVPLRTSSTRLLLCAAASANRRRFGLACADGPTLALLADVSLDARWGLPEPANPVVFGSRILVVNSTTSQLGWLDFSGDQLSLVSAVAQVTGPAGTWPVSLGNAQRRTVFRAADLDGGGPRLLAFEYVDPPVPANWVSPVRTFVSVFSVAATSMSFNFREALDLDYVSYPSASTHWVYYPDPGSSPDGVRWEKFIVMRSGFGPQGSSGASRDDIFVHAPNRTEKYAGHTTDPHTTRLTTRDTSQATVQAVLRWDSNNLRFVISDIHWTIAQEGNALPMPATGSLDAWRARDDDQYLPISSSSGRSRLLAFSPSTLALGLLAYDPGGRLQTQYFVDQQLTDSSGVAWIFAADDRLIAGQFLVLGAASAILGNFGNANVCVLDISSNTPVPVFSQSAYRLESPGGPSLTMRPVGDYDVVCLDIDNDGLDEVILKPAGAAQLPGYSIWHGLPGPFATVGNARFGGPLSVTEFEVLPLNESTQQRMERAERIKAAYVANSLPGLDQNLLYLDEAYYFVAVELAIRLHDASELLAALDALRSVYDYEASGDARLIAYKLVLDAGAPSFVRALDWLNDPLAPHTIAGTRRGAYRTYTRVLAARFLLDAGDADLTAASPQSVERARELYLKALDLLPEPAATSLQGSCADLIGELSVSIGEGYWILPWLKSMAGGVKSRAALKQAVTDVAKFAAADLSDGAKSGRMLKAIRKAHGADSGTVLSRAVEAAALGAEAILLPHQYFPRDDFIILDPPKWHRQWVPAPSVAWCIRDDPESQALRRRAASCATA